jgi:hypothetical protein
MGGNVGIGTTSPGRLLHVSGTGTDGTQVQINGTGDSAGIKLIPVSGDNWEIQANTSNQFFVYNRTDSAYRFLIDGSGNVGIGTTAPSEKLHVAGNAYISGVGSILYFDTDASSKTISQYVTNLYEFHIVNGRGNSAKFVLGNGSISLGTNATPQFFINTGNGNVGIGTTSPTNGKLVISDSGSNKLSLDGGSSQNGMRFEATGGANAFYLFNGTISSAGFGIYNVSSGAFPFFATNAGNVGIGTTAPNTRLHTTGSFTVDDIIYLQRSSSSLYLPIANYWNGSGNPLAGTKGDILAIGNAGGDTERMRITSGGQVLIGQTTASGTSNGMYFRPGIESGFIVTSDVALQLGRLGTTGDIQTFYTGSTRVGKIAVGGSSVTFESAGNGGLTIQSTGAANFVSSVTATSFFESSDKTIKTLIEDNYQTKGIESVTAKLYLKNGVEELGYFAQDVQGILPSAVSKGADGLLNLSYREVHTAKIARLEKEVEQLKAQLNSL